MPRILLLGATGNLGSSVASALLLTGLHTVYGLTRSSSSGKSLAAKEINPVICADPANDPSTYLDAIKTKRIDVVIDCTAAYGDSVKFLHAVREVSKKRLETAKAEGVENGPKMGYIYISGAWVHGGSAERVTDLDPVGTAAAPSKALDLVGWRPAIEREVLGSRDVMDVMVFRPASLYGMGSTGWTGLWAGIAEAVKGGKAEVELPMPEEVRVPNVHVDDVADAVVRGVGMLEGLSGCGVYPVFDLVGSQERLSDILNAFARVIGGGEGKTRVKLTATKAGDSGNAWLEAMGSEVNCTSARAKLLLGWEPRREVLVTGMDVYAKAWEAGM